MEEKVNLELTKEEAIVLFEFLSRFNINHDNPAIEHQAEQRVLWDIECVLEKKLVEPLGNNYMEVLNKARHIVSCKNKEPQQGS